MEIRRQVDEDIDNYIVNGRLRGERIYLESKIKYVYMYLPNRAMHRQHTNAVNGERTQHCAAVLRHHSTCS